MMLPRGLFNDRMFMVVDPEGRMMTQREHPRMALINVDTSHTESSIGVLEFSGAASLTSFWRHEMSGYQERRVTVWKDTVRAYDQGDEVAAWLTKHLKTPCRLVRMVEDEVRKTKHGDGQVAFADGYPVLGASHESLLDLNGRMASAVPMNRFRPNIVFEGAEPFAEDKWRRIRIVGSDVHLIGQTLCARCAVPSIDQATGEPGKEPGLTLSKFRRARHITAGEWKLPYPNNVYFGRNFVVDGSDVIAVGMEVEVLEVDD